MSPTDHESSPIQSEVSTSPTYNSSSEIIGIDEQSLAMSVSEMTEMAPAPSCLYKHDASCCQTVEAALMAIVATNNARGGLAGVLSIGARSTEWGAKRCEWLCEAWRHRKELDCGAQAALLQLMLELSDEHRTGDVLVLRVGVIMRCSSPQVTCWNRLFAKEKRTSFGQWIHPTTDVVYHECLAIANATRGLMVFDPAGKVWLPASNTVDSTGAILAWLVHRSTSATKAIDTVSNLTFGDAIVPMGRWFTFMPSVGSTRVLTIPSTGALFDTIERPVKLLGSHLTVYISGVSCNNDNPSPGLGVARSLRAGCQSDCTLRLVAVDFSMESLGLRDPVFDGRMVFPSWEHSSASHHLGHVLELLRASDQTLYISCLDIEIELLARELHHYVNSYPQLAQLTERILIPSSTALTGTRKPTIHAASALGFIISDVFEIYDEDNRSQDMQAWCIDNGYPVFVKGRNHDAAPAYSWAQVQQTIRLFQKIWGRSSIFLQRSVVGTEGSIIFAAYKGQLLAAALMTKRIVTSANKVWSSHVTAVPDELLEKLRSIVRTLVWTGGGEIEFIETIDGKRSIIDWNPRFPAWIYGTVPASELNFPLALAQAAADDLFNMKLDDRMQLKLRSGLVISANVAGDFVRTIIEQRSCGVVELTMAGPESSSGLTICNTASKAGSLGSSRPHPSRNTEAAKLLCDQQSIMRVATTQLSRKNSLLLPSPTQVRQSSTPRVFFDSNVMCAEIDAIRKALDEAIRRANVQGNIVPCLSVTLALSIKTNPSPVVLTTAVEKNMLAEAISLCEVRAALAAGFAPSNIILNGPGKWFDSEDNVPHSPSDCLSIQLLAVIADSATELEWLATAVTSGRALNSSANHRTTKGLIIGGAQYLGVRLAAPGSGSRFGADVGDTRVLERLAAALRQLPADQKTIYHFHSAPSMLGIQVWAGGVKAVLSAAHAIDRIAGRACSIFDFGGGWAPGTFTTEAASKALSDVFVMAATLFPQLSQMIFEPGKAILQSAGTLVTRVLCMRESSSTVPETERSSTARIAILDTSIAETPDIRSHNHPLAWLAQDTGQSTWLPLLDSSSGNDVLCGRICMEHDILATSITLPDDLRAGDWISIGSVGAYDMSMAYNFGTASGITHKVQNL